MKIQLQLDQYFIFVINNVFSKINRKQYFLFLQRNIKYTFKGEIHRLNFLLESNDDNPVVGGDGR